MEPAFQDKAWHIINAISFLKSEPKRQDVVAVSTRAGRSIMYLKRIIGLPQESISIIDGTVWINGVLLAEPYVKYRHPWQVAEVTLDDDQYYVIGDNRGMAQDHHAFGRVSRKRIIGKVLF